MEDRDKNDSSSTKPYPFFERDGCSEWEKCDNPTDKQKIVDVATQDITNSDFFLMIFLTKNGG